MSTYNKITLNGTTLIDLSTDTVAVAGDITSGKVGHLNTGASATGTAQILDTSDATATSSDILSSKTAYVNGSKITGSITSKTAQTYTPTTTNQTISSGQYLSGTQTIAGDANLVSANIASGVSIFGVAGSHSGGSANIQSLSVTENGTYTAPSGVDGYSPVVVNVSGGDSGGSVTDPVRFIDYDGTILYSYSVEDFANLTEMPANPTHTGLTSQGWNWTLANAKAQLTAHPNSTLTIGQLYVTNDGKTRIYISLTDSARLSPYFGICPKGTVVVNWGDNTATDTLTGTSLTTIKRVQHTYASTGDYVITLEVTSGTFAIYGSTASANGTYLLTRTDTNIKSQRCYQNAIQKVELGVSVSIGAYAFYNCYSLASITMPNSITSINNNAFYYCNSLTSITIPNGITSISANVFQNCHSLTSITIPNSVKSIETYAFYNCYTLASITIPNGVTRIDTYAFQNCYSLASITMPNNITSISINTFHTCHSLTSITIPNGVKSINSNAFYNCYSFASITIPNSVTHISNNVFDSCYSVAEYHFLPTTPPTLSSTDAFNSILSDCKMYVPSASLTAYQEATNWSTYASYMVGE